MSEIKKNTVTVEEVKANMQDVFVTTINPFGKPITLVTVKMLNGYTITETVTCCDPANYSEEIGKEICLERIERKVWEYLGYEKMYEVSAKNPVLASTRNMMVSPDYKERFRAEFIQVFNRFVNLSRMCDKWDKGELDFTPTCARYTYNKQMLFMREYLAVLLERSKVEHVDVRDILASGDKYGSEIVDNWADLFCRKEEDAQTH